MKFFHQKAEIKASRASTDTDDTHVTLRGYFISTSVDFYLKVKVIFKVHAVNRKTAFSENILYLKQTVAGIARDDRNQSASAFYRLAIERLIPASSSRGDTASLKLGGFLDVIDKGQGGA
ncbi:MULTISPECIES: hypothetical protein [unclassified Rhizobium]|uniref:hypothetical protein n=1 Tax=unclassified Rhizobium TaxID=2613769 RepID=UPI00177CD1B9|nr:MULTISPECIES: hypothetical protein [unclassified Rhizobium]MBD8688727.1 hypothetical protein [Rhizobium sp. CFBP 13644]MBD8694110.1 hypothetical protein [Rhizobium sp. CFBP 13717]